MHLCFSTEVINVMDYITLFVSELISVHVTASRPKQIWISTRGLCAQRLTTLLTPAPSVRWKMSAEGSVHRLWACHGRAFAHRGRRQVGTKGIGRTQVPSTKRPVGDQAKIGDQLPPPPYPCSSVSGAPGPLQLHGIGGADPRSAGYKKGCARSVAR